jgi:hypothetical protein
VEVFQGEVYDFELFLLFFDILLGLLLFVLLLAL